MDILNRIKKLDISDPKVRKAVITYSSVGVGLAALIGVLWGFIAREDPFLMTSPYIEKIEKVKVKPFRAVPQPIEKKFIYINYIKQDKKTNEYFFNKLKPVKKNVLKFRGSLKKKDLFKKYAKKRKNEKNK